MRWLALIILCLFSSLPIHGALVEVNGKWSDRKYAPVLSMPEYYDRGYQAYSEKRWEDAAHDFTVLSMHFPNSPFFADALYYLAVSQFELEQLHEANKVFDRYLNLRGGTLKHFEEVFEYKLTIAERFASGSKKPLFGVRSLPSISPAKKEALEIFDEVVATLPNREIAAKALYGKALLLQSRREYRDSIETLQTLARRFPKHPLAAEGYLCIAEVYLDQAKRETQNPDLLSHAQINLQRFEKDFPGDIRTKEVAERIANMEEIFARSLFDTGKFYERKKKSRAAAIYYEEAVRRYPETAAAQECRRKLPANEVAQVE